MTPEESFRTEPTFLGKPLQPFSFLRQTAAQELGLKYGRITEQDLFWIDNPNTDRAADEPERIQMYNGLLRDAAIVMWVCTQPDREVMRARRKPDDYEARIDAFAEEQGITMGGKSFEDATTAFFSIMAAIAGAQGKPEVKNEEGGDSTPKL